MTQSGPKLCADPPASGRRCRFLGIVDHDVAHAQRDLADKDSARWLDTAERAKQVLSAATVTVSGALKKKLKLNVASDYRIVEGG